MPNIECPVVNCTYETGEHDNVVVAALLMAHTAGAHNNNTPAPLPLLHRRPPRVDRPLLTDGIDEETWNAFKQSWNMFVRANDVTDADQSVQLYSCCAISLKSKLTATCPDVLTQTVEEMLTQLKCLAVIPVAISVKRNDLLRMNQDAGETIRTYHSRVKAKAITCRFRMECTHNHAPANGQNAPPAHVYVNYTNEMIRHVVLNGLYDDEIRRDVFGNVDLDTTEIDALIILIESKETARDATGNMSASAISQFKRIHKENAKGPNLNQEDKCRSCGNSFKIYKKLRDGKINKAPFTECQDCWKRLRRSRNQKKQSEDKSAAEANAVSFSISSNNLIMQDSADVVVVQTEDHLIKRSIILNHHVFIDGNWRMRLAQPHPTVDLEVSTIRPDYDRFGAEYVEIAKHKVTAIVDSGAQCCLWGWKECETTGLKKDELIPVKQKLNDVSKSTISISGAVILQMSGTSSNGETFTSAALVYVSPDVSGFYLSKETMIQLKIIPASFPSIGATECRESDQLTLVDATSSEYADCGCLRRAPPPRRPNALPMDVVPENVEDMKQWLLATYGSSTFNDCPHQTFPTMKGPPMRIHVDPEATPVRVRGASHVPIHWEGQVERDIDHDEAMDVVERVPHGEPTTWLHRLVINRKEDKDGNLNLRRTVDLSPLNKYCMREEHAMKSPFDLAKGIPSNTWRTVVDAWNGFHSVPLHEDDRNLTMFLSPKGHRYRYKRAPQGFASSGDGFNRRFDELLGDFERHKRCVDDVLHYDNFDEMEKHWWRTIDLLELLGASGIVLNPKKFQFCKKDVNFAGFHLTEHNIEPLPKYIDSIKNFPTPGSITDIRSWFGLVNQVSHYAQLRDLVAPFRKFLSPKVQFYWNNELDEIFNESKRQIMEAINDGVQIFDPRRRTCLRCDWSKRGIGFYLTQKHCFCDSRYPDCCDDGWRITLCGSRFLKPCEERYAPIEGEALAVAWSLEQTKYFTMGCDDLVVVVDHKPLTKILDDRALDEIANPRLFRLKQRTLPWLFEIYWMPGKGNSFSDATSRHPSMMIEGKDSNDLICLIDLRLEEFSVLSVETQGVYMAAIRAELDEVLAVSWNRIQEATFSEYNGLLSLIQNGFPDIMDENAGFREFWEYRNALHIYDDVIMYHCRVVVPPTLRDEVLQSLHAAHQGQAAMKLHAQSCVFWPGITLDIERTRQFCRSCNKNAPSQPKLEPVPPVIPTTPFECIVADYFDYKGMYYLVIADRLSGWTECYRIHKQSDESGSSGLVTLLKKFFGTFGVPVELSSDGGTEFVANYTQDFLTRWGVRYRGSAAYNSQSNGRAELAVKSTKRLLEDNIGPDGELHTEKFLRALLIKRNTPDPTCKLSSAEIVFGRKLRDTLPRIDKNINIHFNKEFRNTWREAWTQKESALRTRYQVCQERLAEHSKALPALEAGDRVALQNQTGSKPRKWDRSGMVVEVRDFDKYIVKVDGSGRLTLRNRRFLKKLHDPTLFSSPLTSHSKQSFTQKPTEGPEPVTSARSIVQQRPSTPPPRSTISHTLPSKPTVSTVPIQSTLPRSHTDPISNESCQSPVSTELHETPVLNQPNARGYSVSPRQLSHDEGFTSYSPPRDSSVSPRQLSHEEGFIPYSPRRGTRNRKVRLFYNAETGTYVDRNSGDNNVED